MKLTKTLFKGMLAALVLLVTLTSNLSAQDSCTFRLRIYDAFGDSWDDSQLYIKLGNNPERAYTHNGVAINQADSIRTFFIRVKTGDSIILRYEAQGPYQDEIAYTLFNNADEVVFRDGLNPREGIVFRGIAKCKNCGAPNNFRVDEVRTTSATARWSDGRGFRPVYHLQWDTAGFRPGTARNRFFTTDTFAVLTNLQELKRYDAYVTAVCAANDSASIIGPVPFFTDTATDVSVTRIVSPTFGRCDMGVDTIKFLLTNSGGVPQQLIKFAGSVNGQNLPISFPADGLYTGVISRDSSALIAVKSLYDFTAPGKYVIRIWSEVDGDKNRKNDTATITIVRPRVVTTLPYFQNFEASEDTWSVLDTVGNSTWEYGTPNGAAIKGAYSGTKAWTTWKDSTYRLNEFSYLYSPCFNFTNLTADPRISMRLAVNSEATFDGLWLEQTTDNGRTWSVVGGRNINTGVNWYNDSIGGIARSTWGRTVDSVRIWRLVQNVLRGVAGKDNVRLRFGFRSDASGVFDGVAIDDILVSPTAAQDLAMQYGANVSSSVCGSDVRNVVTVRVSNMGTTAQTAYTVNYQVGAQTPVSETPNIAIAPNQTIIYTFTAPFNTTTAGDYSLKTWVSATPDALRANDTATNNVRITLERPLLIASFPYTQGFESGSGTWSTTDSLNGSWALVRPNNPNINAAAGGNFVFKVGGTTPNGSYNNSEWSYLLSPCFNFSTFTADPRINLALNFHSETRFDASWLEGSTDGGVSWRRIGNRNTGVNWYNDTITGIQRAVWTGVTVLGWRNAQNTLTGFAGQANCRLRFVFRSDASVNSVGINGPPYGGIAVDNIVIGSSVTSDLSNALNGRLNPTSCGSVQDTVAMLITNVGTQPQSAFSVSYRIDNQAVVNENVTLTTPLAVGASGIYRFMNLFNSTATGTHTIRTWVRQANDTTYLNDTAVTTYFIPTAVANFASYNFNDLTYPQYWVNVGFTTILLANAHGNPINNGCAYANLWSSNQSATLVTHRFGPVRSNRDSISFDYRIVNEASPFAAYTMSNRDTAFFEVATDCNEDWVALNTTTSTNHIQSTNYATYKFGLGAYVGKNIRFRWRIKSAITTITGYWYDLDNVNFITCPENFGVQSSIRNTRSGQSIGSVALRPTVGLAPFTYAWSNGRTTDSIGGLVAGTYSVTITDARGCTQSAFYTVTNTVGINDLNSIFSKVTILPNPTTGSAFLDVEFARIVDVKIQVLNIVGQPLVEKQAKGISQHNFELDLSDKPSGVYLVRIIAENRNYVAKIVKH